VKASSDEQPFAASGPLAVLEQLESYCREHSAVLLFVDFSQAQGLRSHAPMTEWAKKTGIETVAIWPEEIKLDGKLFDPGEHFHDWRERQFLWSEGKTDRLSKALSRVIELRLQKQSYEKIAAVLNDERIRSATGKPWTGEMVRKLRTPSSQR